MVEAGLDLGGVGGLLVASGGRARRAGRRLRPACARRARWRPRRAARCTSRSSSAAVSRSSRSASLVFWISSSARFCGGLAGIVGVEGGQRVVGRAGARRRRPRTRGSRPCRAKTSAVLASTARGGLLEGGLGLGGGAARLDEHRLLAGHVGGQRVEGGLHLGVGGLEGVDLARDLGLLRRAPARAQTTGRRSRLAELDDRSRHERAAAISTLRRVMPARSVGLRICTNLTGGR